MYNGYQNPNYNYEKGAVKSMVQKALLSSAANVGEGLVPQHLEKLITNTIVRLAPEIAVIDPKYDAQKYHEFNRLTSLPAAASKAPGATIRIFPAPLKMPASISMKCSGRTIGLPFDGRCMPLIQGRLRGFHRHKRR